MASMIPDSASPIGPAGANDSALALLGAVVGPFIASNRKPLVLLSMGIVAVATTAFSHIATPWLIGNLIDAVPHHDIPGLRKAVVGLFGVAVLASASACLRDLAGRRCADLFRAHLRTRLMRHVFSLKLSDVEANHDRELNAVFADDVNAVSNLANPLALQVCLAVVQLAGALAIIAIRFNRYAWLVLLVVPVNAVIAIWELPAARTKAREQVQIKTRLDSLTLQVLEGLRDVKSLAAGGSLLVDLSALTSAELLSRWRSYLVRCADNFRYTVTWLLTSVVYFIGGLAVIRGELSIGSLTAFVWYVGFLDTPISRLWQSMAQWQRARASVERYVRVMRLKPEIEGTVSLNLSAAPEIELRNVGFCYPGASAPALTDVSIRLAAGQHIAVVGASGAGKTTLVSLLLRLFDPEQGSIMIGGRDVRQYTLSSLRRYVTIISQEPFIFDGTIRNNLGVGLEECSESDLERAAAAADADGFINELPQRYDTSLGARGAGLSGGQKRRLAIARAVARQPRILILDEVTGALDSESDLKIQSAIEQMSSRCTTITVTHRLSSTVRADVIVVLDSGRVVGIGTHETLLRDSTRYRSLAKLQKLEIPADEAPESDPMESTSLLDHVPAPNARLGALARSGVGNTA